MASSEHNLGRHPARSASRRRLSGLPTPDATHSIGLHYPGRSDGGRKVSPIVLGGLEDSFVFSPILT